MSKAKNIKGTKIIKDIESDDEIEIKNTPPVDIEEELDEEDIKSTSKSKKPYVLTEARKNQFDKARLIRLENCNIRKQEKEITNKEYNENKKILQENKMKKLLKKQNKELELYRQSKELNDGSSDEEEIVIMKKKKQSYVKKKEIIEEIKQEPITTNKTSIRYF